MYDKGDRVLRIEAIADDTKELKCGRVLEKLPEMLAKLQLMLSGFSQRGMCRKHELPG